MTTDPREDVRDPSGEGHPRWVSRFLDARGRVHRTPGGRTTWRLAVGIVGVIVLLAGVVMLAVPGPGWATIVLGLVILSTEFEWAARARHRLVLALRRGAARIEALPAWLRAVTWCAVAVVLGSLAYLTLAVTGVPDWVPAGVRDPVRGWPLVRG